MDTDESIKDYLETQINDLKKVIKSNLDDLNKSIDSFNYDNKRIAKLEQELVLFKIMYPKYINEEFNDTKLVKDINEMKNTQEHLRNINSVRINTIELQRKTVDLLIKKLVDLNVNLSWITRD